MIKMPRDSLRVILSFIILCFCFCTHVATNEESEIPSPFDTSFGLNDNPFQPSADNLQSPDSFGSEGSSYLGISQYEYEYYDYGWDLLSISPETYQQSFCSERCRGKEVVEVNSQKSACAEVKCFPCDCVKPRCQEYNICCPDESEPFVNLPLVLKQPDSHSNNGTTSNETNTESSLGSSIQKSETSDTSTTPKMLTAILIKTPSGDIRDQERKVFCVVHGFMDLYLVIRSCPNDYHETTVKRQCEENVAEKEETIKTYARITDNATYAIYYNQYCAECNQVTQVSPWQLIIECASYINVYGAVTQDELLRLSLKDQPMCYVKQMPSEPHYWHRDCVYDSAWFKPYVETCNETGQWAEYDPSIETACHYLNDRIYRTMYNDMLFKNIFCLKCNVPIFKLKTSCSSGSSYDRSSSGMSQFTLLFGFEDSSGDTFVTPNANCSENEWSAPDGTCLSVKCANGKILKFDNCTTAIDQIRGLPYTLNVWLHPTDDDPDCHQNQQPGLLLLGNTPESNNYTDQIYQQMMELLKPLITSGEVRISIAYPLVNSTLETILRPQSCYPIHMSAFLGAHVNFSRDAFEHELLARLVGNRISLDIVPGIPKSFQPYITRTMNETSICDNFKSGMLGENVICETKTYSYEIDWYKFSQENSLFLLSSINAFTASERQKFIFVHKQLLCPFVRIKTSETTVITTESKLPWERKISLNFGKVTFEFAGISELNQILEDGNESSLSVCLDLMDQKFSDYRSRKTSFSVMALIQHIETIVCSAVSILCLLFTLVTYFMFSSLRCEAGINNMFLTGSLALAQILLLSITYMLTSSPLCTVMGILTHYSWLFMLSWSFICCFHMFRVFASPTRPLHNTNLKKFITKHFIASLILPSTAVISVICTYLLTSGGHRIGYGRNSCYLDNALATVIPFVAVTACNFTPFAIVVFKIWRVRRLQRTCNSFQKKRKDDLTIYTKLSTLTGVFWLLAILAEALKNDPLRLISIALNGCQGLFIFISYMWNRRVLKLYYDKFGWELPERWSQSFSNPSQRTSSTKAPVGTNSVSSPSKSQGNFAHIL